MYEHKKQKLASKTIYRKRVGFSALIAFIIVGISLLIGIVGYHETVPEFDWYDSLLNASMILSGMGPVFDAHVVLTPNAKIFASFYALFCGISFLTIFGVLVAPLLHRFFHRLHLEDEGDSNPSN